MFQFWLVFGVMLIIAEALLPGLVSIFIGFGAMTVAAFIHYNYVDNVASQLVVWFVASTIYIFTLRLLIMKFYPSDTQKQNINEDQLVMGQEVEVVETIVAGGSGRISYGDSTWQAVSKYNEDIKIGEKVKVLNRENITWLVERAIREEK